MLFSNIDAAVVNMKKTPILDFLCSVTILLLMILTQYKYVYVAMLYKQINSLFTESILQRPIELRRTKFYEISNYSFSN